MTRADSVLFHVSPSSCDTCRHRVWTCGVSVCFDVPLCYCATCRLPVYQRVIFSFCHMCLSGSDMWRRRGKFLCGLVSPRGSDRSHIPIGPRVLSTCRVQFICVRSLLDHVSVSYWTTHPFLVLENARFGPPRVRNHYMSTFIQIHFITEPMKQRYYSEKLALLF